MSGHEILGEAASLPAVILRGEEGKKTTKLQARKQYGPLCLRRRAQNAIPRHS